MFWGLILKANRKYTQTIEKSFHLSHAVLDVTSSSDGPVQVVLTCDKTNYILCTLRKNSVEQVNLDLNFKEGEEISFTSQGSGSVHLSGYLVDDFYSDEDDFEDELGAVEKPKKAKKISGQDSGSDDSDEDIEEGDEEDTEEDSDENDSDENKKSTKKNPKQNGLEKQDPSEDESDDDSSDEEIEEPVPKKQKQNQNGATKQQKKKDKPETIEKPKGEKVLTGGVKIEDIRVGQGIEAKPGKKVQVYYEGRLKSNNKVFDSSKSGAGFKFGLGKGEVIKGWDIGVAGMKVGGKRKIICPPHMAYGQKGSPPVIPPQSTLIFEVELKGVH